MVVNKNENIGMTLQLIKSDGISVEEGASVTYQIFDSGMVEVVTEQATVYNSNTKSYIDSLVPSTSWKSQKVGSYIVVWTVGDTDDDFNSTYTEELEISIDKDKIDKILGLVHQNIVIDETEYDNWGNLSGARIRLFHDSNKTNLLSTYQITSVSTDAGKFTTWEQVEV